MAINAAVSVLDGLATPVSRTFEINKSLPNGNDRILNGSSIITPTILQIRHYNFPAKGTRVAYDRRVVTSSITFMDGLGNQQVVSFSGSMVVPRASTLLYQQSLDVSAYVRNFWSGNMGDLMQGKF